MAQGLRTLGRSGLKVSPLCLGAMNFGNDQFGCDEKSSIAIIHAYLDAGHNFIDTANVYSGTKSETIVGKAVKGRRDRVVIATKASSPLGAVRSIRVEPQTRAESVRRQPAPARHRLHRSLSDAPLRRDHAARRNAEHAERSRPPGQSALPRRIELDRIADHRSLHDHRGERLGTARQPAAAIQHSDARHRGGDSAGVPEVRPRRDSVEPARRRHADRQIQGGRRAEGRHPFRRARPVPARVAHAGAERAQSRDRDGWCTTKPASSMFRRSRSRSHGTSRVRASSRRSSGRRTCSS